MFGIYDSSYQLTNRVLDLTVAFLNDLIIYLVVFLQTYFVEDYKV